MAILMTWFQADAFMSVCTFAVELVAVTEPFKACVHLQHSRALGESPLFLAGHQVFTLDRSSFCPVDGNS